MFIETALVCMALNTYHEARGETVMGRHAVAQVTMNRAERDPKNVCKVVTAKKQFSWTNKAFGLVKVVNGRFVLTEKGLPTDADAWSAALKIAKVTLNGQMSDFTRGADHYHTKKVDPPWNKNMTVLAIYGTHRFFRA